ncbi:IS256 family transposase [Streptomyces sp. ISL-43]|uniref:IS256 family transposase n=1 Tax=Streptomyces sp. ISL-43 TaxID=2819183 RepID=UPI002035A80D|nr:IS256 family transposase [Streptomyces sp. ISL-43]
MVDEVVERLLDTADASGAALLGEGGLLTEITRAVLERALEAEMSEHLGYERGDPAGHGSGNSRNGTSPKTVLTDDGAVTLAVPRDRNGEFEPSLVPKNARRLAGFNDRILSFYARGMSVRDIRSHLAQIYGVEVSPDLISKVTDTVVDELVTWQNRPLDPVWPIIYIDALWVKIRSGSVTSKPVYLAVGVDMDGRKDVLGLWVGAEGEGATTWMAVLSELRNRGIEDVCIVACDGSKGLPDAVTATWLPRSCARPAARQPLRRGPADQGGSGEAGRRVTDWRGFPPLRSASAVWSCHVPCRWWFAFRRALLCVSAASGGWPARAPRSVASSRLRGLGLLLSAYSRRCRRAVSSPWRRYRWVRGSEALEARACRTRLS